MFDRIIKIFFDKKHVEKSNRCVTVIGCNRERENSFNVAQYKKTALSEYFCSLNGLKVKERGYAVICSSNRIKFSKSVCSYRLSGAFQNSLTD